jgi:putative DNA primase/helicase
MNSNKNYVNLANGMLNLYSMELVDHDPSFLSTIRIPIAYDVNATCPEFLTFLSDVFEEDEERIRLVQELLGYCFWPEIRIQKAFIFIGFGSNGKSVLAEVIRHLVGIENVSNVAMNDLGGSFGMESLPDKLVNISTENEFDRKFNTQNFKMLTGGDAVNVKRKYKNSINIKLFAKAIVLLNRMMDSDDMSNGYFRRLQIIPFNKVYRELKSGQTREDGVSYMDKTLTDRLLKELPGILIFALEGLSRLIKNDFNLTESKVCEKALEDYRTRMNPVAEYFNEKIFVQEGHLTLRSSLKEDFDKWAFENGLDNLKSVNTGKFLDLFRRVLIENNIPFRLPCR